MKYTFVLFTAMFVSFQVFADSEPGQVDTNCSDRQQDVANQIKQLDNLGSSGGPDQKTCVDAMTKAYKCCFNPSAYPECGQFAQAENIQPISNQGANTTGDSLYSRSMYGAAQNKNAAQYCYAASQPLYGSGPKTSPNTPCNNLSQNARQIRQQVYKDLNEVQSCYHMSALQMETAANAGRATSSAGSAMPQPSQEDTSHVSEVTTGEGF